MGSFCPIAGNRHLHRYYNFTEPPVETAPRSLRLSCGSELFFFPVVVMTEDIVVGINYNGKNPGKTKEARIQIQKLLEDNDG